jgi:hypothetical protein
MTLEPPMEQIHEQIHHEAHHSEGKWATWVALSTALLAALAAVAALRAEYHAHEALHAHLAANDKWSFGQAKNEKGAILAGTVSILQAMDKPVPTALKDKIKDEDKKKEENYAEAKKLEIERDLHDDQHNWIAAGVTFFQVAVAISAIAILTKRRWCWYLSLVFGVTALALLIYGEMFMPAPKAKEEESKKSVSAPASLNELVASYQQQHEI